MSDIEIVKTNANDIKLDRELYAKAYDNGFSFSQLLERIDPSEHNSPLDAFERQLMRFGIRTQNDPRTGEGASKGEMFFQSNEPASRILFPEYLNRIARVALMAEDDVISEIVSSMNTIPNGNSGIYRAIYIDDTESQRQFRRVAERGGFPVVRISWSEKTTTLAKYGVAIQMSYEFIRRSTLPIIQTLVSRIMLQTRIDELGEAITALVAGDGSGHASGGAINDVLLYTYQGGSPTGTQDMTYTGYLKWLHTFYPGTCTHVLGDSTNIIEALTIAKPSTDPLWMYALLDKDFLGGRPQLVNGRLSANVRYVMHNNLDGTSLIGDSYLIGIDKRYALIGYREAGTDLTETDKIINGQWNEIVMSNTIGFQTVFANARCRMKTTGTT